MANSPGPWECRRCTLINMHSTLLCSVCGAHRPRSDSTEDSRSGGAGAGASSNGGRPGGKKKSALQIGVLKSRDADTPINGAPYNMRLVPWAAAGMKGSVLMRCDSRTEWFDTLGELIHLCNESARRKLCCLRPEPMRGKKGRRKTKSAIKQARANMLVARDDPNVKEPALMTYKPLSLDYVADRLDTDDPIRGYIVRTKAEGWMQGFVIWTTWTTWTKWFQFNSEHKAANMGPAIQAGRKCDVNGALARELQSQERQGDAEKEGVIWPRVAEISLLGGLGCGRWIMRLLIDQLSAEDDYDYLVVHSTAGALRFYEKLGFIRVGAIARYVKHGKRTREAPIVGYRHWTFADQATDLMAGVSYMMARRVLSPSHPLFGTSLSAGAGKGVRRNSISTSSTISSSASSSTSSSSKSRMRRASGTESLNGHATVGGASPAQFGGGLLGYGQGRHGVKVPRWQARLQRFLVTTAPSIQHTAVPKSQVSVNPNGQFRPSNSPRHGTDANSRNATSSSSSRGAPGSPGHRGRSGSGGSAGGSRSRSRSRGFGSRPRKRAGSEYICVNCGRDCHTPGGLGRHRKACQPVSGKGKGKASGIKYKHRRIILVPPPPPPPPPPVPVFNATGKSIHGRVRRQTVLYNPQAMTAVSHAAAVAAAAESAALVAATGGVMEEYEVEDEDDDESEEAGSSSAEDSSEESEEDDSSEEESSDEDYSSSDTSDKEEERLLARMEAKARRFKGGKKPKPKTYGVGPRPFLCHVCGKDCKTPGGYGAHQGSKACREAVRINKAKAKKKKQAKPKKAKAKKKPAKKKAASRSSSSSGGSKKSAGRQTAVSRAAAAAAAAAARVKPKKRSTKFVCLKCGLDCKTPGGYGRHQGSKTCLETQQLGAVSLAQAKRLKAAKARQMADYTCPVCWMDCKTPGGYGRHQGSKACASMVEIRDATRAIRARNNKKRSASSAGYSPRGGKKKKKRR